MDKRLLLLMLGLSLLLGFLQALRCYRCPHIIHDGSCKTKRTTCDASFGKECALFMRYEGDTLLYGSQDCRYFGRNISILECPFYISVSVCTKNFCNKFRDLQLKRDRCPSISILFPSHE
ncbi:prostate and testis expressed protein 14-like [Loxodonta africana]|uniref:prostate and testis expressed protein 14-like n=1 Tax=Loxodonta africana TaxID=9785 RepID=UPI0030D388DD